MKKPRILEMLNLNVQIVIFAALFLSCLENKDGDTTPSEKHFEFFKNKQIIQEFSITPGGYITSYYKITDGDKIVFSYRYVAEQSNSALDDEFQDGIFFQIDNNLNQFNFQNSDIFLQSNCVYWRWCFCPWVGQETRIAGYISGTKISEYEWYLYIDIEVYFRKSELNDPYANSVKNHIKIDRIFILNTES
jgi:hypothetical protein